MRKLAIIFFLLGFLNVQAQNRAIKFEEGSFQEALDKAKKSEKLLFVDCYTSWCGPCKMLARDVFTNDEVADYFNEHFISFKVDCEKGEGPELQKRFGVSGYPTMLFINKNGEVVNKIVGASRQPHFLEIVKKGLDPEQSIFAKEQKYNAGCRDRNFVLNLIEEYKRINEVQKAKKVSIELLGTLSEKKMLSEEIWNVIRYYYVSTYGSQWWNFILEHSDDYVSLVGKAAVADKIGETMHPYLFGYIYGDKKAKSKTEFKVYKELIDKYQPEQKEILYDFITLGESASFDNHDKYVKTVIKIIPQMNVGEHFRFFFNAIKYLTQDLNAKQKKQLVELLEKSLSMQKNPKYFEVEYKEFIKIVENC